MVDDNPGAPVAVGLDDGYALTKLALPDGRLLAVPSRARVGRARVTWLAQAEPRIAEYRSEDTVYAAGEVDGEPTAFEGYPVSGLNRVIVQHALQQANLAGHSVHAVSGLPVSAFYGADGAPHSQRLQAKRASLKRPVQPLDERLPAAIAFHDVIPEALAAWYDHVIVEQGTGVRLDPERLTAPIAVIDIGGRTTDVVVVAEQAVRHATSGSLRCGLLDVKARVAEALRGRFDLEELPERVVEAAVQGGQVRLYGQAHDVAELVAGARREVLERLRAESRLGLGAELDRVLFVGGGSLALAAHLRDWFPNQLIAEHPAFANARGMLKYLRYVCAEPG